jgi:hypothetical protein
MFIIYIHIYIYTHTIYYVCVCVCVRVCVVYKLIALATQVARKRTIFLYFHSKSVDSKFFLFCAGKLNAPQILRARKVLSYAVSKLALEIPPHMRRAGLEQTVDYLELLCHDQLVPPGICICVCDEALRYYCIRP